jgi:hypothetical protein
MQRAILVQLGAGEVSINVIIGEGVKEDRRIYNYQCPLRSALSCAAAAASPTLPPDGPPARASTSETLGRLARSLRIERRYSCSDIPASAARRRSTACVSSGTSLT